MQRRTPRFQNYGTTKVGVAASGEPNCHVAPRITQRLPSNTDTNEKHSATGTSKAHTRHAHTKPKQVKFAQTFITTYESGSWSGNPDRRAVSKLLPTAQLNDQRTQILKAMVKIRAQVR